MKTRWHALGAAAVAREDDNLELHGFDTVKGSDFLGDQDCIVYCVEQAPKELALLETLDMGKPISDSLKVDVPSAARCIHWYAEAIDKLYDEAQENLKAIIETTAASTNNAPGSEAQKVGDLYASFMDEAAIEAALRRPRDADRTALDVLEMRARMAEHKPAKGPLDVKLLRGGLVDLEFITHYLQLREGKVLISGGLAWKPEAAVPIFEWGEWLRVETTSGFSERTEASTRVARPGGSGATGSAGTWRAQAITRFRSGSSGLIACPSF